MVLKGSEFYEEHFLFSNRVVKLILILGPYHSSIRPLFQFCIIVAYLLPMIVLQFYYLLMSNIKLQSNLKLLQKMLTNLCIICTYSIVYFRSGTIQKLLAHFKNDYERFLNKKELYILEKYMGQIKLYTIIFAGICCLYAISLMVPSLLSVFLNIFGTLDSVHVILPFPINNVSNAGTVYYSLLIYQITAIFITLTITFVCYSSYLVIIQHACMQFTFIMFKISQPFKEKIYKQNFFCNRKVQKEQEWVIDIIEHYIRATEFVDMVNNFSKIIYIVGVFLCMVLIFFDFLYMLQLPEILQNTNETFECFIVVVGSVLIIYINFYIGQLLIDHNRAVFYELCQVPFYILSIKTQKLLLLMIIRSMKPCGLSIGGMFVVSHEIFVEVDLPRVSCPALPLSFVIYKFFYYLQAVKIWKRNGQLEIERRREK